MKKPIIIHLLLLLSINQNIQSSNILQEFGKHPIQEAEVIHNEVRSKLSTLYDIEKYTNNPDYKRLDSQESKKKYLKTAFLMKKIDIIRKAAIINFLKRFVYTGPILGIMIHRFSEAVICLFKVDYEGAIKNGAILVGFGGMVLYFMGAEINKSVTDLSYILHADQMFDFKQKVEIKLMEAVASGLGPIHIEFVLKKLKETWDLPKEKKKNVDILDSFLNQVFSHEKKKITYDLKAFRKAIKDYPKKIQKEAEQILFHLFVELSTDMHKKKKIVLLLTGKAGFGKTRFARELAKAIGVCFANMSLQGNNEDLFGKKGITEGKLAEAMGAAKKTISSSGHVILCCDDADRLINQKGTDVTDFLNFLDPTNFTYINPFYDNVPMPAPDVIILTGNFALKDTAISDRVVYEVEFNEPFSTDSKFNIAMKALEERLNSKEYQALLGCTIDKELLKEKIRQVMENPKNKNFTARQIQNKTIKLFIKALKDRYDQKNNLAEAA